MGGPPVGARVLLGTRGACWASVSWGRGLASPSAAQGGARLAVSCACKFSRSDCLLKCTSAAGCAVLFTTLKSLFALIIINRVYSIRLSCQDRS